MNSIIEKCNEINLLQGLSDTLLMVVVSTLISFIIGTFLGFIVVITDKDGIKSNMFLNKLLGVIINLGRSIPFIILMIFIIPFTRLIAGKSWGPEAAIVPLTIGAIPFVARLVEVNFKEIDKSLIESVICMGADLKTICFNVYLKEALPSLIRGLALTMITIIAYSAMAGSIGAGGLGDIAIKWGYQRYDKLAMYLSIIVIIILVEIIQIGFDFIAKKIDRTKL